MIRWAGLTAAFLLSTSAFGGTIFSDGFESGQLVTSDLNWSANTHGLVVQDPLNPANHVLEFTGTQGAGDAFTITLPEAPQNYLSFDYLYLNAPYGGGFIGIDDPGETWLAGDCNNCFPTGNELNGLSPGVWNHIQIQFTGSGSGSLQLKLEQFVASAPNAFFDNIVLSDSGFASATPEPGTALLLLAGLAAAAFARKRLA